MAEISQRTESGPRKFKFPSPPASPSQYDDRAAAPRQPCPSDYAIRWNDQSPESERLRKHRPKVIAIWMRKGGVGKSNITYMLGHALAKLGVKTMMVDCDSQQDLTELCFRAAAEKEGYDDTEKYILSLLPQPPEAMHHPNRAQRDWRNVHSLAAAVRFTLELRSAAQPPQEATGCHLLHPFAVPVKYINHRDAVSNVNNLYLVTGGSTFEDMEKKYCEAMADFTTSGGSINAAGCWFHSIWQASFHMLNGPAEIILLDMSPALGCTNQALLLHSDYFIVPCEVNKLSEKNLSSIPGTLKEWYKEYQDGGPIGLPRSGIRDISRGLTTKEEVRSAELPLPEIEPKFLGIVLNRYDIKQKARNLNAEGRLITVPGGLEPEPTPELFRNKVGLESRAARIIQAATHVASSLCRSTATFAIDDTLFTQADPDTGLNQWRHPDGSPYCPQPKLLARIFKTTSIFEYSTTLLGVPMSQLSENDFRPPAGPPFQPGSSHARFADLLQNIEERKEDIAHFRRIFEDLARFIRYLPEPEPYNFVFDYQSYGRDEGLPDGRGGSYPTDQNGNSIDARRTAGTW